MRAEKRKKCLAVLLALLLLLAVPVTYGRVLCASENIGTTLQVIAENEGTIRDRHGMVIDEWKYTSDIFKNIIGGNGLFLNAIDEAYAQYRQPRGFSPTDGLKSVQGTATGCDIKTTLLSEAAQQKLATAFGDYHGVLFAYNYKTGEIYTALYVPTDIRNETLNGLFQPGSTMKVVALATVLQQDNVDVKTIRFDCNGVFSLPDGSQVTCGCSHGRDLTIVDIIGKSCNCGVAYLATLCDPARTEAVLQNMGFVCDDSNVYRDIGHMYYQASHTSFKTNAEFSDVWSLVGQGNTAVSAVDMARIAGAIANGGKAADPYLVETVTDPMNGNEVLLQAEKKETPLFPESVSRQAELIWRMAFDTYYGWYNLPDCITHCKTGTIEVDDNGNTSRSLIGVMEPYDTAFFILVEGLPSGDPLCMSIAAVLADQLQTVQQ